MFDTAMRAALCALFVGTSVHHPPLTPVESLPEAATAEPSMEVSPLARALAGGIFESNPLRRVHRVTAYCDDGLTAAGVNSGVGQCAAPADIPFGSIVYLPELDQAFVVTDRTARRFRHNTVDIFIPDCDDCLEFGLNYLDVEIYLPIEPPRYGSSRITRLIEFVQ